MGQEPGGGLQSSQSYPAPKKKRRIKPSDRELASLWIAAEDDIGYPYGDIIRLGMLLKVRRLPSQACDGQT